MMLQFAMFPHNTAIFSTLFNVILIVIVVTFKGL